MAQSLSGKKTALLVANGFDEAHMTQSQRALLQAGAKVCVVSTEQGLVNSWNGTGWGHHFAVESHVGQTLAADFQLLVIPGGERSITRLMTNPHTRRIITSFADAKKPIAVFNEGIKLMAWAERPAVETMLTLHTEGQMDGETLDSLISHLAGPANDQQVAA